MSPELFYPASREAVIFGCVPFILCRYTLSANIRVLKQYFFYAPLNASLTELEGIGIRYNKTTDWIQIQDELGDWHDRLRGNLKFDGYIYKDGVVSSYTPVEEYYNGSFQAHTVTFNESTIDAFVTTNTNGFNGIQTEEPIDLSNYSSLKMTYTGSYGSDQYVTIGSVFGASLTKSNGMFFNASGVTGKPLTKETSVSATTYTVDISSLSGPYYIYAGTGFTGAGAGREGHTYIQRLWLE